MINYYIVFSKSLELECVRIMSNVHLRAFAACLQFWCYNLIALTQKQASGVRAGVADADALADSKPDGHR